MKQSNVEASSMRITAGLIMLCCWAMGRPSARLAGAVGNAGRLQEGGRVQAGGRRKIVSLTANGGNDNNTLKYGRATTTTPMAAHPILNQRQAALHQRGHLCTPDCPATLVTTSLSTMWNAMVKSILLDWPLIAVEQLSTLHGRLFGAPPAGYHP
ncbi:hypothetical protein EV421DRAFT_1738960 [Armillaria borealis]|uniref:Uncharacterized protein n=1 Tax=Armillaria borealis TaxID=47425 RepID=A0AA39MKX1_9AGAR|nr:hypothetical protein EV421DRAFT_1738960 [Armillaria borealis]